MGRKGKSVLEVLSDFSDDFTLIDDSLLLCKYCKTVVNWKKRTRIQEHIATKMHEDRKANALSRRVVLADDFEQEENSNEHATNMDNPQQYCLRWNNHQTNMLKVFTRLLSSEQFTDVLIAAEGNIVKAHKVVLSACSSYFESLFTSFNERNQILILKDTTYADLNALVEFMYKGEVNVAQEQLPSLLKTAENLKVKGLAEVTSSPAPSISSSSPSKKRSSPNNLHMEKLTLPPPLPPSSSSSSSSHQGPTEVKRKRGRPRTLDSPGEIPDPCFSSSKIVLSQPNTSGAKMAKIKTEDGKGKHSHFHIDDEDITDDVFENGDVPTPGGPLTPDKIRDLGIVKMNEYLVAGTRQQFWEEYYVKVIMQAVRNKELDMKSSAELLGVSYGTLYGRYRETFGYLKHGWNLPSSRTSASNRNSVYSSPSGIQLQADLEQAQIFEQLKTGRLNMKQAGALLGIDSTMLAYQLALKTTNGPLDPDYYRLSDNTAEDRAETEEDDNEVDEASEDHEAATGNGSDRVVKFMEVQPDIVMAGESSNHGSEQEDARDPIAA